MMMHQFTAKHWVITCIIILVAVGTLIGVILYFATLYKAKKEKTYQGSVPLVVFGATAAAIIADPQAFVRS